MTIEKKDLVLGSIDDLVIDFVKYDRIDDSELSATDIEELIKSRTLTVEQMVTRFREALETHLAHVIPTPRRR